MLASRLVSRLKASGNVLFYLALSACGNAAPPPAGEPQPPAPTSPAPSPPPATPSASAPAAPTPSAAVPASAPSVKLLPFQRLLEAPVHSLALGKDARVAALGADAWLDDGKGFRKLPRPAAPTTDVQIYFGRDDQPRLMGFFPTPHERQGVYARLRKGAWERGASEIGKLGTAPMAALFGVLGYDDPEVVCAPDKLCIIKRLTGWTMLAPPPGLPRVELCNGVAWAYERAGVHRLHKEGWRALDVKPTFSRAEHLWAIGDADLWLTERETDQLHHFDGAAWKAQPSPVKGPRGLWATSGNDVWLAADGGAAHYDGKTWSRVEGATTAVRVVTGRSAGEVWLAGDSGVWRGRSE
jgi:hypothetical protein